MGIKGEDIIDNTVYDTLFNALDESNRGDSKPIDDMVLNMILVGVG